MSRATATYRIPPHLMAIPYFHLASSIVPKLWIVCECGATRMLKLNLGVGLAEVTSIRFTRRP